jgi:hypothetical protein
VIERLEIDEMLLLLTTMAKTGVSGIVVINSGSGVSNSNWKKLVTPMTDFRATSIWVKYFTECEPVAMIENTHSWLARNSVCDVHQA